jgi:hypothetical protein
MKLKNGNLFELLNKENSSNNSMKDVFSDVDILINNIDENTILKEKIAQINKLAILENLNSSKEVYNLLNKKFSYTYPFAYKINEWNLSEEKLTLVLNLKAHIKNENNLNEVKNIYFETEKKIKLFNEDKKILKNTEENFNGCSGCFGQIFMIPLTLAFFLFLLFNDTKFGDFLLKVMILVTIPFVIFWIVNQIRDNNAKNNSKDLKIIIDDNIKKLKDTINDIIYEL